MMRPKLALILAVSLTLLAALLALGLAYILS